MISCKNCDYIELACTFGYPIKLTLKSNEVISCIAKDTSVNADREECLKVVVENENTERLVALDKIVTMKARIDNPHFQSVTLGPVNTNLIHSAGACFSG